MFGENAIAASEFLIFWFFIYAVVKFELDFSVSGANFHLRCFAVLSVLVST